jgi:hypothetical protein
MLCVAQAGMLHQMGVPVGQQVGVDVDRCSTGECIGRASLQVNVQRKCNTTLMNHADAALGESIVQWSCMFTYCREFSAT